MRRTSLAAVRRGGLETTLSACSYHSSYFVRTSRRGITTHVATNLGQSSRGIRLWIPATGIARAGVSRTHGRLCSRLISTTSSTPVILPTARVGAIALSVAGGGRLLVQKLLPRINCQAQHPFNMDKFFILSNDLVISSQTLAEAVARSKRSYGWSAAIAAWSKYLFGLGLALVGSFGVWYLSRFYRPMAERLWPAFVFGALPMLVVGYLGRLAAAFLFMGAAGYGYLATMNYWESDIVAKSLQPLSALLVDRSDIKELVGDWGNNLKPHLETYEITTNLLHFATEPAHADFPRAANGFVFVLTGSDGQALVRVLTELNFEDKRQYSQQVEEFFEQIDDYSRGILNFLQPFSQTPGPYPSIPQFRMKGVEIQYADVSCVAGPKRGQKIVLVDNMQKYAEVKAFKKINNRVLGAGDIGS